MEKNNFRKIATITLFESAVQWYCFLLYGTAAGTVFNKVFFSQTGNGTTALILSYMSFAIGYIAGPFGAIFFGHIGDRKGRKVTMYASLLMMGISTSIIGILPPAASAGVGVVIVLQLMRLAQCFGRGGTWGGGILMAYENVPENKRSFYAAIPQIGLPIGFGLSSILIAVPTLLLPEDIFFTWGWRIPFLAAIILTVIVIRQKGEMMETEDYKKAQAKLEAEEAEGKKHKVGFIPMVKGYWKTLLLGCGTRWVDGTFYNIFIVWILSYCINWLGMPLIQTYIITIIACIFKIPFTLFGGWCAQKLGNTRTFVIGALASAVLSIFVDQWDWEKVIRKEDRNLDFLEETVKTVYKCLRKTEQYMAIQYDYIDLILPKDITFVTTSELEEMFPDNTPKEREYYFAKAKGAICVMQIGDKLANGEPHDGRAPDYDDWALNADIIVYYPVLDIQGSIWRT